MTARSPLPALVAVVALALSLALWCVVALRDPGPAAVGPPVPFRIETQDGGEAGPTIPHTDVDPAARTDVPLVAHPEDPSARIVHGVVLDRETRRPLPKVRVRVQGAVPEVETRDDGRFELPVTTAHAPWLEARATPPWAMVRPRIRLEPESSQEVVLLAWRLPDGPVSVVLRDAATGEPIPRFQVELLRPDGGASERAESDEAGVLVVRELARRGVPVLRPIDRDGTTEWEDTVPLDEALALQQDVLLPVGPTYRLALPDGERWEAAEDCELLLFPGEDSPDVDRANRAPLRTEDGPWVRFGPVSGSALHPRHLKLAHRERRMLARAVVRPLPGIYPDVVLLTPLTAADLVGVVLDPPDVPVPEQDVLLIDYDGRDYGTYSKVRTDASGRFAFENLDPGTYSILAQAGAVERSIVRSVTLTADERREVQLVREWPASAGRIAGRVQTVSGRRLPSLYLTLMTDGITREGTGYSMQCRVRWTKDATEGPLRGTFELEGVPAGDYVLTLWAPPDQTWEPRTVRVSPPRTDLEFRMLDAELGDAVTARVVDAATGAALPSFWYWVEHASGDGRTRPKDGGPHAAGRSFTVRPPRAEAMVWVLGAPGYAPVTGDAADLVRVDDGWRLDVALHPGWGMLLETVEDSPSEPPIPLTGVEVRMDGAWAGETDGRGRVWLSAGEEPQRIELQRPGWCLRGGVVDAGTGHLRRYAVHGVAILSRE